MTLGKKALSIIILTLTFMIASLFPISRAILLRSFEDIENSYVREHLDRVSRFFNYDISYLKSYVGDWANWDDTYNFVENPSSEYINPNMVDSTFRGMRLNLIAVVNSSGKLVFAKAYDLELNREVPLSMELRQKISSDSSLMRHDRLDSCVAGVLPLAESPMIVVSRPILTSNCEGPIRGALVMGRYLNAAEVSRLGDTARLGIKVSTYSEVIRKPDLKEAALSLSADQPYLVSPKNKDLISGFYLVPDIHGQPYLVLSFDLVRVIYHQGQTAIRYLLWSLLALSLVFSVVVMLLLKRLVLNRLKQLSSGVIEIASKGDVAARVKVAGNDELASLSKAINGMLEVLDGAQREIKKNENRMRYLSLHDTLTGFYNRAFFEEEMRRMDRGGAGSKGVIMCDVDELKPVNDTLGHEYGDKILVAVASVLRQALREGDIVARVGGDEFAILIPDADQNTVEGICRRISEAVNRYNAASPALPLSISTGFAVSGNTQKSMVELFREADNAMYQEKALRYGISRRSGRLMDQAKTD